MLNGRHPAGIGSVERQTGSLYADIWELFTDDQYKAMAESIWFEMFELEEPLAPFVKGASVLDGGCGGGSGILMLLRAGAAKVTGVDISEKALGHCRRMVEKYAPERLGDVELHQASLLTLPFADGSFDMVYSNGVLHHTSDPERGFAELVRVLKPGGILWVGVYGSGGLMTGVLIPLARAFRKIIPCGLTRRFLRLFTSNPLEIYRVLDPMYVPFRFAYTAPQIRAWLDRHGLLEPLRTHRCAVSFYKYGPWMSGAGWVGFRARKPQAGEGAP